MKRIGLVTIVLLLAISSCYSQSFYQLTQQGDTLFYSVDTAVSTIARPVVDIVRFSPVNTEVDLYIDNTVTDSGITYQVQVGEKAFLNDTTLKSVAMADSVQIKKYAFSGCKNLEHIQFPRLLTTIEKQICWHTNLDSVIIPDSVKRIEESAFCDCYMLKYAKLPEGLQVIEGGAFYHTAIEYIDFPASLTTLYGFDDVPIRRITFPDNNKLKLIYCFDYCPNLEYVNLSNTSITNMYGFQHCTIDTLILPDSVQTIGSMDETRINYLSPFPPTIEYISGLGISTEVCDISRTTLEWVVISLNDTSDNIPIYKFPITLKSAGWLRTNWKYLFFKADTMESLFSNDYDFNGIKPAAGIKEQPIIMRSKVPPTLGEYANIDTCYTPLYVPCESVEAYKRAPGWRWFADIRGAYIYPTEIVVDSICPQDAREWYGVEVNDTDRFYVNVVEKGECDSVYVYEFHFLTGKPVAHLTLREDTNKNILTWQGDGIYYNVYRNKVFIGSVTDTIFEDYAPLSGVNCYSIQPAWEYCDGDTTEEVCTGLSVPSVNNNPMLKVYPNPVQTGILMIENSDIYIGEQLQVIDVMGRVVHTHTLTATQNQVDVSALVKGIYFVKVKGNTSKVVVM
jgi:hypothetical protein